LLLSSIRNNWEMRLCYFLYSEDLLYIKNMSQKNMIKRIISIIITKRNILFTYIFIKLLKILSRWKKEQQNARDSRYLLSKYETSLKNEYKVLEHRPYAATSDTLPSASRYSLICGQCNTTPSIQQECLNEAIRWSSWWSARVYNPRIINR